MLASITLLPAVLGLRRSHHRPLLGPPRARARSRASRACGSGGAGSCSGARGRRSPAGSPILLVLAIPLLSMRLAFPDAGGNPTSDTTRQAYDLVADGFGAGFNGPLILAAEFPKGADTAAARHARRTPAGDARRRRGDRRRRSARRATPR